MKAQESTRTALSLGTVNPSAVSLDLICRGSRYGCTGHNANTRLPDWQFGHRRCGIRWAASIADDQRAP
jgi:hypothetical protein